MNNIESRIRTINRDHIRIRNRLIQDVNRRHREIDYELFHNLRELNNYTNQLKNEIMYETRFNPQRNHRQQIQNPNTNMLVRQLSGQANQNRSPTTIFRVVRQLPGQGIQNQTPISSYRVVRQLPGPYPAHR